MTYQDAKLWFEKELSAIYNSSETDFLFSVVIQKITGWDRFNYRKEMAKEIGVEHHEDLKKNIIQLKLGKPYQQILGETEFYGLPFFVDEHVLIPRPETEELLELAIEKIQEARGKMQDLSFKILDIGTGSGIIPIVLKKHFPNAQLSAIDFSEKALMIAQRNADFHQVDIHFMHQDYLKENLSELFDVIISNPPYIGREEEKDIADSVKEFEPKMALFSPTSNALIFYEKIAKDCNNHLAQNGLVFLEINQKLGEETLELFTDVLSDAVLLKDLSCNDRFVWGRK